MKRTEWIVLIHFVLAFVCGFLLKTFIEADGSFFYKFIAGFFIGTYALFGKEVAKLGIVCFMKKKPPVFDTSVLTNYFMILVLIVLALAGLFAWYVSWVGSTGLSYGLAVFFAAVLSDFGLAPFFKEHAPK